MHEIAERAGVGKATVSLALRDDPRLRPETRRRIQKLAAKMGYRTNATISNLMAQLRASRTPKYQATLALLTTASQPDSAPRHEREWLASCHQRAAQLGYGIERFSLLDSESSPTQLAEDLAAHNIRGLIIAGLRHVTADPDPFALLWQRFSCVAVGLRPPMSVSFTSNDQFSTTLHAVHRLWDSGYRRIALVLSPELDTTVERRFSAGFRAAHEILSAPSPIPPFPFNPSRETTFRAWQSEHTPDAILTLHEEVKDWLEAIPLEIPTRIALAHLDHHAALPAWSGMRQNHLLIGAAAIDMLVGQLHRNESGLPQSPHATCIQSTWIDGLTTTRPNSRPPACPPETVTATT
jgi:LacI family transcriptional regulator